MVSCQRLVRRGSTLLCLDCNLLTICFLTNVCWISHFLVPTKGSFPWQLTDVWPKAASHVDHFPIFMMHLFNFICSWNTGLTKDEMTWLQRLSAGSCSGRAVKCCCASTTAAHMHPTSLLCVFRLCHQLHQNQLRSRNMRGWRRREVSRARQPWQLYSAKDVCEEMICMKCKQPQPQFPIH